jgi:hypothetical protein
MALSQKYLERLARRRLEGKVISTHPQSYGAERSNGTQELTRQTRAAGRTGPLVVGPPRRSNSKDSWREDAQILEELCPEDFGPPRNQPSEIEGPRAEPQLLANAPESPQSTSAVLPAPSPIPLASTFWQSLLFGNPDSLVPSSNATRALQLISDKLGVPIADGETIDTVRAGQLRKLLHGRFGLAAEQTMSALWRSAPASPGAPQPDIGQTQLPAGALPASRSQPQWIAELNEPGGSERAWLIENGLWCG